MLTYVELGVIGVVALAIYYAAAAVVTDMRGYDTFCLPVNNGLAHRVVWTLWLASMTALMCSFRLG